MNKASKYQTMRIDHLKHLNAERVIGSLLFEVEGETLHLLPYPKVALEDGPSNLGLIARPHDGVSLSDIGVVSDIDPKRVKIEYIKVHNSEAIKAVLEGSKDYWFESGECYVHLNMESSLEEFCNASKQVRVPIEWWEDAKACHDSFKTGFGSQHFHRNEDNDTITISGEYTRDQLCDLARELLEFND